MSADPATTEQVPAPPMPDVLTMTAERRPEHPALIDGARVITFTELEALVVRLVAGLRAAGLRRRETVAWCGRNCAEVMIISHVLRRLGVTAVPVPYTATAPEMDHLLRDSGAAVVLADAAAAVTVESLRADLPNLRRVITWGPDSQEWVDLQADRPEAPEAPPAAADGDEVTAMIYTSGTTGRPKGARRGVATDPTLTLQLAQTLRLRLDTEVHLTAGPLYHSGPWSFSLLTQLLGGTVVTVSRFDPVTWLELVERHGVTTTFCAATHMSRLVAAESTADTSSLHAVVANAAPVPYPLKVAWVERFGEDNLNEVYGATELGVVTVLEPADQLRKPGSCGRPYGDIEVRAAAEDGSAQPVGVPGELFVRSPLLMTGYHGSVGQPSKLDGGWMSVGDVAYLDSEGFVFICDRLTDMVISGGVNVYPAEVEAALLAYPDVVDAAVLGLPDDDLGERVHAAVVAGPGGVDLDALRDFAAGRLSGPKRPRSYELRETLPRTESGKLLKRVLREEHGVSRPARPTPAR